MRRRRIMITISHPIASQEADSFPPSPQEYFFIRACLQSPPEPPIVTRREGRLIVIGQVHYSIDISLYLIFLSLKTSVPFHRFHSDVLSSLSSSPLSAPSGSPSPPPRTCTSIGRSAQTLTSIVVSAVLRSFDQIRTCCIMNRMLDSTTVKILVSLLIPIAYWIWWRYRRLTLLSRCGIPGPRTSFWTGNFLDLLQGNVPTIGKWIKEHGKIVSYNMGVPTVGVADAELVRLIQVKVSHPFIFFTNPYLYASKTSRISTYLHPVDACFRARLTGTRRTCVL